MKDKEPTNRELATSLNEVKETTGQILEAIGVFSNKVEARFDKVDQRFDRLEGRVDNVEGRLGNIDGRVDKIGTSMVTKDYLDDKLFDFKGDIIAVIRKEDYKVGELVTVLQEKKVLNHKDVRRIRSMEPFPKK